MFSFKLTIDSIPVEHAVLKQVRADELAVDPLIIQDIKQFLETNYRLVGWLVGWLELDISI
jgi:hypothetical protein